MIACNNI